MTNILGRVNDKDTREKVTEIVRKSDLPVGVAYVSKEVGIPWPTARALLMELLVERAINGTRTANGWIFYGREKQVAIPA